MKTFMHSGDMGDIIYSMPTIRALGGGKVYLDPFWEATPFNKSNAKLLMPLLVSQPYISGVAIHKGEVIEHNLNKFRCSDLNIGIVNLAEAHLRAFGLPVNLMNEQWLSVGKKKVEKVVFHRSDRYQNASFPWKGLVERFKNQSIFVGLREEHERFTISFGDVPFYRVCDFLELAEIINGADLFVGNQSLPFAISEGLHKQNILEVCESGPNCNFEREGHNVRTE